MPAVPRPLREQFKVYERAGFTASSFTPGNGSHWKVRFDQFSGIQVVTVSKTDPHGIRNNVARYRRLVKQKGDKS